MPGPRLNVFSAQTGKVIHVTIRTQLLTPLTKISFGLAVGQLGHVDRVGPVWQRELDGCIVELLHVGATALIVCYLLHSDNL